MRPRILISAASAGRVENYIEAVEAAGATATAIYAPKLDLEYDGLLLSGGADVDPEFYGQENCGSTGIERERDLAELELARAYMAAGKPVFGICRGLQLLNIVCGGTLVQDMPTAQLHTAKEAGDAVHETWCAEGSAVYRLFGKRPATNSNHHQAIDRLGRGLLATQWSEAGAVIEAIEHKWLPVFAVQWHPERMCVSHRRSDTADGLAFFQWIAQACQR